MYVRVFTTHQSPPLVLGGSLSLSPLCPNTNDRCSRLPPACVCVSVWVCMRVCEYFLSSQGKKNPPKKIKITHENIPAHNMYPCQGGTSVSNQPPTWDHPERRQAGPIVCKSQHIRARPTPRRWQTTPWGSWISHGRLCVSVFVCVFFVEKY